MWKQALAVHLALLGYAHGQTVPNGTIQQNQVWSPAQWNLAWQSKTDAVAEIINVRSLGARCDNTTDDRDAFAAAITRANTLGAANIPSIIYVPAGLCRIFGTHGVLPSFAVHVGGSIRGDGPYKSWVIMDSSYVGDLFSWDEAWVTGVATFPQFFAGPHVQDLIIQGDRASSSQNALMFYDRTDLALIENVTMQTIPGSCISFGRSKTVSAGGVRESNLTNIRCSDAGVVGTPAIDFVSTGTGGGNPVVIRHVDVYDTRGPAFSIRNLGTAAPNQYKITRLRLEGKESNPNSTQGDLFVIGDAGDTGTAISNVSVDMGDFLSVPSGFCAMRVTGHDATTRPLNISVINSNISTGGGTGKGLCLDAIRGGRFQFGQLTSVDTNVTVGSLVQDVVIDGGGLEGAWTWSGDQTAMKSVRAPIYATAPDHTGSGSTSIVATTHDATASGGNAVGLGAVDLQPVRSAATQVPSATGGSILGGAFNTASATYDVIAGGYTNVLSGAYSAVPGGRYAADRGRSGILAFANGPLGGPTGSYQQTDTVLRGSGSGATAFTLTNDALAAGSTNCMNIPAGTGYGFSVRLHARDFTTPGKDYDWYLPNALLIRDTNAASTVLTLGTPAILSRGTITGAAVAATADTTNGCLSLTFAPPTANTTDVWHAAARIGAVEVQ